MSANTSNYRILVIDDMRSIHEDFRKVLGSCSRSSSNLDEDEDFLFGDPVQNKDDNFSFKIDSAYQGQDGLNMIKAARERHEPYALAFVDVRMPPGWDGIETTEKIWEVDPDIQIVICTAYSDYSWEDMRRKLGDTDRLVILKKPFDNIEVIQLASSLTRKWQLLQDSKQKLGDLEEMVIARTAQMMQEQEKFRNIFENSPEGIFQIGGDGRFICVNPALASIYGFASVAELTGRLCEGEIEIHLDPQREAEWKRRIERDNIVREFESEIRCKDGSQKWISKTACKITKLDGSLLYYQGFVVDITVQKKAQRENHLMEAQLRQAQKLESVGQLAAGIAHEINTPVQYIGDNIRFVEESFAVLNQLLADFQKLASAVRSNAGTSDMLELVEISTQKADLAYLTKEIPLAVRQSLEGVNQVASIVLAMKEFSHPGNTQMESLDINHAIQTATTVARNEWKYAAELVTDFEPGLPAIACLPAEINQVFLNLIINAAHAIGDKLKDKENVKGIIKIATRKEENWVRIEISDTGTGIPEAIRHRVFEPFFTTKAPGKGTGQGLAIAHSTVVKKHGGQLSFESTVGQGTTFTIRLPISR